MSYNFETFQKLSKEQLDASSAAVSQFAKGLQAIAAEASDYSKKSLENGQSFVEKLIAVKKVDEAIALQSDFAKQSYEGFVAQATKIGTLYTNLLKDSFKYVEDAVAKAQTNGQAIANQAMDKSSSQPIASAPVAA